jgi:hypothetical protein
MYRIYFQLKELLEMQLNVRKKRQKEETLASQYMNFLSSICFYFSYLI